MESGKSEMNKIDIFRRVTEKDFLFLHHLNEHMKGAQKGTMLRGRTGDGMALNSG